MHIWLFDIDGTIMRTNGAGQKAMLHVLREEFHRDERNYDIPTSGRTDRAIVADLFHELNISNDESAWESFRSAYFEILPRYLHECGGTLLPGIQHLIETLKRREDVAIGLLTGNFQKSAFLKLAHFSLDHHFEFGGFGDEHPDRDDVAAKALVAAKEVCDFQVSPDRIWVLGDTPADVRCARAIGANVVAVATGQYSLQELEQCEPDLALTTLEETARLVSLS